MILDKFKIVITITIKFEKRMQGQTQQFDFNKYLTSVTSEVDNINTQREQREKIYQKCMRQYKQHLEMQIGQLKESQGNSDNKTNLIRESYKKIYDNVHQDSDHMLRLMKKTFLTKKKFWKKTIEDFVDSDDLELKKKFHEQKKVAQESYQDAIASRRTLTRIPYDKLVSLGDRNKRALTIYQEKNRTMEMNANLGTFLKVSHPEWQIDGTKFDDKQNSLKDWAKMNQEQRPSEEEGYGIIRHFMKK